MNQYLDQRLQLFLDYYQDNWSRLLLMIDYAQLTLLYSSLRMMYLYELLNGYLPQISFNWIPPSEPTSTLQQLNQEKAKVLATWIQQVLKKGRESIKIAQVKKEYDINTYC